MKQKIIKNIKNIISEIGNVTTGEMQSESSQVYKNRVTHHSCSLVEGYNFDNITVIDYVHETEVNLFYAPYEDLTIWQLKKVFSELKEFAELNEKS